MSARASAPFILLPYQARWCADKSRVKVCEKSRRIGITWATAANAVVDAARVNGMDTWYISYDEDQAKEFILDCADWARNFNVAVKSIGEEILEDEDEQILVYVIRFDSGYRITALTSNYRKLRGKQGRVIIDEAAFHEDVAGLLKAALALLIWGGRLEIISTHDGEDNPFNRLCETIRRGEKRGWSIHRITFAEALADGLYPRICLKQGIPWTQEGEDEWVAQVYADYGSDAAEELDVEPKSSRDSGLFFKRSWFRILDYPPTEQAIMTVRAWDKAATPVSNDRPDPDWTRGVKMAMQPDKIIVVHHVESLRGRPYEVEQRMKRMAELDGRGVRIGLWQDPGQAGVADVEHLTRVLAEYEVKSEPARKDKTSYARPYSSYCERGLVALIRGPWNEPYLNELEQFTGEDKKKPGYHDDQVDASSRAFRMLTGSDVGEYSVQESSKKNFWSRGSESFDDDSCIGRGAW